MEKPISRASKYTDEQELRVTVDTRSQHSWKSELEFPEYQPKTPWFGGHGQTLRTKLHRPGEPSEDHESESLVLPLRDGTGDALSGVLVRPHRPKSERDPTPLVVLLHGLGGTSQSTYMKLSARYLLSEGHRVLMLNFRGAGTSAKHCDRMHHPGRTEDITALLHSLQRHDEYGLLRHGTVLVGYSLGGNVLLKFLGELAEAEDKFGETPIKGAVTVSAPLNLESTARCLRQPSRWIYQQYLLRRMRQQVLREGAEVSDSERKAVRDARSVWEFDKQFTSPRCGYETVEDYYRDNSALRFLPKINLPTLLIYGTDDPFVPAGDYQSFDWDKYAWLNPLIRKSGGHVGFYSRGLPTAWHNLCIDRFVDGIGASDEARSSESAS